MNTDSHTRTKTMIQTLTSSLHWFCLVHMQRHLPEENYFSY